MSTAPPIKWHGGKSYLAKWIIGLMPPRSKWCHYVEPYFGGGNVLLQNDPEGISEVANDVHGELMNFWRVLQNENQFEVFRRIVESVPFSELEWTEASLRVKWTASWVDDENIRRAIMFFIRARQSRQGLMRDFATVSRNRTRRGMNEQVSAYLSAVDGLPDVHTRMRRVLIFNRPALDVIKQQDGPKTLFYVDPTYKHETRSTTDDYANEMADGDHSNLLAAISKIKGWFMLSGYRSGLYDDAAERWGWRREEQEIPNNASSAKTKERKIECVWMNY